jgi:predicted ArsR family transcriptional regulator
MTSTRERILQTLLTSPRSAINDLALAVGINGISVRHHLTNLQADGLVTYEEERHGVGRPRLVYLLTEKGLEHFPTRYLRLTNSLLDQMRDSNIIQTLSINEKLDLIKQLLSQEGFSIEWEKQGNQFLIHEITCPYYHIGKSHPEVCKVDQTLISTVLSIPVEKISCVLRGDTHCTYVIEEYPQLEKVK